MSFFYGLHTGWKAMGNGRKNISYAATHAIPTPFIKKLLFKRGASQKNQAIGETEESKRRTVPSVSFSLSGSLTVEAALVLPLFLGAVLALAGLFQALSVCERINYQLCMAGRELAAYSLARDGISITEAYAAFYGEAAAGDIPVSGIVGGYGGILLNVSEDENRGTVELKAVYRIRIPGYLIADRSVMVTDRIYFRPWIGGKLAEASVHDGESGSSQVYVAEHGVVYHTNAACTYLQLSIHQHTLAQVANLRNKYGAKYYPCESCGNGATGNSVYITDTGRAWHWDRQCSGLKRELHTCSEEEAVEKGLRPCSRCGN